MVLLSSDDAARYFVEFEDPLGGERRDVVRDVGG